jgi:hypothetical protein
MKWEALEYPTALDTSVTLRRPSSSSSRARSRRSSLRNWYGERPVTSRNRCEKEEGLRFTCSAISLTVMGSEKCSWT